MSRVIQIDPETDPRWDKFVEKHERGWICHLSDWKRVLEESFGHIKGYYPVLLEDNSERIRAALPIFQVKSWLTGNRMVSIPFATLFDPLVSCPEDLEALMNFALDLKQQCQADYIEIRTLNAPELPLNEQWARYSSYKHHYLRLDDDPEQLKRNFQRKLRQQINRIARGDLCLKLACDESEMEGFYKLYAATRKRLALPPPPYVFLKNLWRVFSAEQRLSLLLAKYHDEIIAGLLVFHFNKRASAEIIGYNEKGLELYASRFLYWEAIRLACRKGSTLFDFGRTSISNQSLMQFKNHWGATVMDLTHFYYPKDKCPSPGGREKSFSYNSMRKVCRWAPDFTLPFIGRFCYRHLG